MILLDFIQPATNGPRVWIDTEEVTSRCLSVELLPGAQARVRMIVKPIEIVTKHVDSGFGLGVAETEVRKQIHSDEYTVLGSEGEE